MKRNARYSVFMAVPAVVLGVALAGPAYADRPDGDNDGLYDDDESEVYFTDPANPDTDNDGPDDGQEVYDGTDPLVANGGSPADAPEQPAPAPGSHSVVLEITGSGTVYSIDTDPAGSPVAEGTAVPFERTVSIGPDQELVEIIAITKSGDMGCRITVDGKVVREQHEKDPFCIYDVP